jgi:hypothetical protein
MSRRAIVLVGSFALTLLLVLIACVGDEPAISNGGPMEGSSTA